MPKHIWTILCNKGFIDKTSNNISLMEVIDQIQVYGAPTDQKVLVPGQFEFVSTWMRSNLDIPERAICRIMIKSPLGEQLTSTEIDIDLTNSIRHRTMMRFNSLPVYGNGIYSIIIEIQNSENSTWYEVGNLPLQIEMQPLPQQK